MESQFKENKILEESLSQLEFQSVLDFVAKYSYSELGKELILKSRPTDHLHWLRIEHDDIEEMILLLAQDDPLPFDGLTDISAKLHKSLVKNAILSTTEILEIRDCIRVSRLIMQYFINRKEKYHSLFGETENLHDNRLLEKHISDTIDDTGEVRDNATKELSRIRKEILAKSNYLRNRLQKILKKVTEEDLAQEDFYSIREGRFVLPIKAEHKRHIPGIIHGMSQTGSTVFMEPSEIIEMNNELSLLTNEEKREIYKILLNLTEEIGSDAGQFLQSIEILSHIDSIYAKGKYALEFGGIKPDIIDTRDISLNKIRHPLLIHTKGMINVTPLTIEFSENKRGHLISGPNAGGKTVALKSIGLNIAMALSGIFPLGQCSTGFRNIYSSIGDHQSIQNDLSTFSSQVIQLRDILSNSDPDSLVLIDEIGSGTDPQEGSALASGILDTLLELRSFFVATTHQSSLKTYALNKTEIENDSLEFDSKALKPTYKFLQGIPGNSYAFVLAKNFGITDLVLSRAKKYLGTSHSELEESISQLQKYKSDAEELAIQTEQEKLKSEKIRKDYEQKLSEIKLKRQVLLDDARQEAFDIVLKANSLVESTIKEIREDKRSVANIKKDYVEAKKHLEKDIRESSKVKYTESHEKTEKIMHTFSVGDDVYSDDSTVVGTIQEIDKARKNALVNFRGLKFKLPLSKLNKTAKMPLTSGSRGDYFKFDGKTSLDIHGKRAAEALQELDVFISNALLGNLPYVTILHGKGTGALRQAVHEFLEKHPSKLKWRNGNHLEGGEGVTIIEF